MKKVLLLILLSNFTLSAMNGAIKERSLKEISNQAEVLLETINTVLDNNDKTALSNLGNEIPGMQFIYLKLIWGEDLRKTDNGAKLSTEEIQRHAKVLLQAINKVLDNNNKTEILRNLHEFIPGTRFPYLKQIWLADRPKTHAEKTVQRLESAEKEADLCNATKNLAYIIAIEDDYSLVPSADDYYFFPQP
jgi:hypothetical protein